MTKRERFRSRHSIPSVRVTYDGRTDTAYIYLTQYEDGDVARWYGLAEHDVGGTFTFDIDKSGKLLGIEVKLASWGLPSDFLDAAERV